MYAVWWAQISAFVGSMTKKWPCPSGGWGQKMNKDKQALVKPKIKRTIHCLNTKNIPPKVIIEARIICNVICSSKNAQPIRVASTGTLNCTVAAEVDLISGKAVYQIAYPNADASTPDAMA